MSSGEVAGSLLAENVTLTKQNAALLREVEGLKAALTRIGNPDFIYATDDDEDTQLSLRMADARAALSPASGGV